MNHRIFGAAALIAAAAGSMVSAQGRDAAQVLAGARAALGGDRLAAVATVTAAGRSLRTGPGGSTVENEFELALDLPDKYRLRSALVAMGNMSIYRNSGFNGDRVIEDIDRPPNLAGGGHVMIRVGGPGGPVDPEKMTPAQKAEADRVRLQANRREFARLALGMFAASLPAYPLEFAYAGQAESPDGKADVLEVKGDGGFAARFFVDSATHLPLMLSWMDKEPLVMRIGPESRTISGGRDAAGAPGANAHGGAQPRQMAREEVEKLQKDADAARAEAEAKLRTVEFRLYYGDYRAVGGVMFPHRIQRSIDGKTTEEMSFDSVKLNAKIDAGTFKTK